VKEQRAEVREQWTTVAQPVKLQYLKTDYKQTLQSMDGHIMLFVCLDALYKKNVKDRLEWSESE